MAKRAAKTGSSPLPPQAAPSRTRPAPQPGGGNRAMAALFRSAKGGACPECKEKGKLHRRAGSGRDPGAVPPVVYDVLRSPGRPLADGVRTDMESRFNGADFSGVRVHTDSRAAESAEAVNAHAYTVGQHIAFDRSSATMPTSLLAHELTHTLQQPTYINDTTLTISSPHDASERHAAYAASRLTAGGSLSESARTSNPSQVQRDVVDDAQIIAVNDDVYDGDTEVSGSETGSANDIAQFTGDLIEQGFDFISGLLGGEALASDSLGKKAGNVRKKPPKNWIEHIEIDLSSQTMVLFWSDGSKSAAHTISTGKGQPNTVGDPCNNQTEVNCTPTGTYTITSSKGADTKNSHGDAMAWYVGFIDGRGIGIHNSQVANGTPLSHGCVRVGSGAAGEAIAKHINDNIKKNATKVNITGKAKTKPWKKMTK